MSDTVTINTTSSTTASSSNLEFPLVTLFAEIIANYRYGLSSGELAAQFTAQHGYAPEVSNLGFKNLMDLVRKNPKYFIVQESPISNKLVIYPGSLPVPDIEGPSQTAWTHIGLLFSTHSYILLEERIPEMVSSMSELKVRELCPGAPIRKFYEYCIRNFETEADKGNFFFMKNEAGQSLFVRAHPSSQKSLDYQRKREEQLKQILDKKLFAARKEQEDKVLERCGFLNTAAPGISMAVAGEEEHYYLCMGQMVFHPGRFYVTPLSNWNPLENLMEKMTVFYRGLEWGSAAEPWEGHLVPGFIVAALCHYTHEFHRARILEVLPKEMYKIQLLDYGDILDVHLCRIRYLHKDFVTGFPYQAIRCRAQVGHFYSGQCRLENEGYSAEETELLRKMHFDQALLVHLKNRVRSDEGEEMIWEVFVHLWDLNKEIITKFHTERHLLLQTRGRYLMMEGEPSDTEEKVVPTKWPNGVTLEKSIAAEKLKKEHQDFEGW